MRRIDALRLIAGRETESLIICNIGDPSRELFSIKDSPYHFYMLGSMGLASSIGLGLALACKDRRVVAIDGDGSVLMNLGSLATIAERSPGNFLLVIIDNGAYGSTGGQATLSSRKADLASMALGAGFEEVRIVADEEALDKGLGMRKTGLMIIKVTPEGIDCPLVDLAPRRIIDRFMGSCLRFPDRSNAGTDA
jgi:sulfopyruvate decarboxylase subunit beta